MIYYPEKWVVLEVNTENEKFYRVFASWAGSYLDGQSWRMSTKVCSITEEGDYLLFRNESGSVYRCHKEMYGACGYAAGVLANMIDEAEDHTITPLYQNTNWKELVLS